MWHVTSSIVEKLKQLLIPFGGLRVPQGKQHLQHLDKAQWWHGCFMDLSDWLKGPRHTDTSQFSAWNLSNGSWVPHDTHSTVASWTKLNHGIGWGGNKGAYCNLLGYGKRMACLKEITSGLQFWLGQKITDNGQRARSKDKTVHLHQLWSNFLNKFGNKPTFDLEGKRWKQKMLKDKPLLQDSAPKYVWGCSHEGPPRSFLHSRHSRTLQMLSLTNFRFMQELTLILNCLSGQPKYPHIARS